MGLGWAQGGIRAYRVGTAGLKVLSLLKLIPKGKPKPYQHVLGEPYLEKHPPDCGKLSNMSQMGVQMWDFSNGQWAFSTRGSSNATVGFHAKRLGA